MILNRESETYGKFLALSFAKWGKRDYKYKTIFQKLENDTLQVCEQAFIDIIEKTGENPKPTTLYMWWVSNRETILKALTEKQRRLLRECMVQFIFQFSRNKLSDDTYRHQKYEESKEDGKKTKKVRKKN